jgi:predicted glycosyltransferase involved in capsule biosynthesis
MTGIIVTHRNRKEHLKSFLNHYKMYYPAMQIMAVEQGDDLPFNRGLLMNIGAHYSNFEAFALCDVDMIPMNTIDYTAPKHPTRLATEVSQFGFRLPYQNYFSGQVLFTMQQYKVVNGYPNTFWGWGGEDDELRRRVIQAFGRYETRKNKFNSLPHKPNANKRTPEYRAIIAKLMKPIDYNDGFAQIAERYEILEVNKERNVTHLKVKLTR